MPRKRKTQPPNYNDPFPFRLRKLLDEKDLTHQALADAVSVTRQTVSAYCDGSASPGLEVLVKIAKYLGCPTDYLLGLSDANTSNMDIRAICEYTGLAPYTVNYLHSEPDPLLKSFYTTMIDELVYNDPEEGVDDIPKFIVNAAEAHTIAADKKSSNDSVKTDNQGNYMLPASDAEKYYYSQAIKNVVSYATALVEGLFDTAKAHAALHGSFNDLKFTSDYSMYEEHDYTPWEEWEADWLE